MEKIYSLRNRVLLCPQIRRTDVAHDQINAYVNLRPLDKYLVKSFHRMRMAFHKNNMPSLFFLFETELSPPSLATTILKMTDHLALLLPMDVALTGCSVDFVNDDPTWTPGMLPPVRVCCRVIAPPPGMFVTHHPSVYRAILACGLWLAHLTTKDVIDFVRS